jgi:hypothetical protein
MEPVTPEELYHSRDKQDKGSQGLEGVVFLMPCKAKERIDDSSEKGEGEPDGGPC